jgi:hypothetical protein
MTPASKEEWATIRECITRIQHVEESVKELKQEMRNQKKESVESHRYISNRRLSIYLTIASLLGAIAVKIIEWLLSSI